MGSFFEAKDFWLSIVAKVFTIAKKLWKKKNESIKIENEKKKKKKNDQSQKKIQILKVLHWNLP